MLLSGDRGFFLPLSAAGQARGPWVHYDACLDPDRAPWRRSGHFTSISWLSKTKLLAASPSRVGVMETPIPGIVLEALAKNWYTYTFWAINRDTARCTPEKNSWRHLIFGLRSIIPTNGSKDQGTPIILFCMGVSMHAYTALPSRSRILCRVPCRGGRHTHKCMRRLCGDFRFVPTIDSHVCSLLFLG